VKIVKQPDYNENRFRKLVEYTSDWLWEVEANAVYTYASPRVRDLLGYDPEEVIGKTPFFFMPPEEADRIADIVGPIFENGEPFFQLENTNVHKNGHLVVLETNGVPLFDDDGVLTGYSGIDRDITSRKQVEQELRQSKLRHQLAIEQANMAFWYWSFEQDKLTYWSDNYEEVAGCSNGIPQDYAMMLAPVHPDDRERVLQTYHEADASRKGFNLEYQIVDQDGQSRYLREHANVDYDQTGKSVGHAGIVLDITEHKKNQAVMIASKEESEISNRAKTEFLANMSHELRTPLNAIIGFSDMLAEETFGSLGDQKNMEYAIAINESGVHLLEIINDILDISKIEAGESILEETQVNIEKTINNCILMVRTRMQEAEVNVEVNVPENLPALYADERQIKQVLINLLSNAIKFTPAAGRIQLGVRLKDDMCLEITVTDTGIGINAKDIPKVLQRSEERRVGKECRSRWSA